MSTNGVSEAFVHATATPAALRALSAASAAFSAAYVALAVTGLGYLGVHGLVLANAANLLTRTAYSLSCIRAAAPTAPHRRLLPEARTLGALAASAALTNLSARCLGPPPIHKPARAAQSLDTPHPVCRSPPHRWVEKLGASSRAPRCTRRRVRCCRCRRSFAIRAGAARDCYLARAPREVEDRVISGPSPASRIAVDCCTKFAVGRGYSLYAIYAIH